MTATLANHTESAQSKSPIDWAAAILNGYLLIFFAYMFLPMIFMVIAAFNASPTPSVIDWQASRWNGSALCRRISVLLTG